MICSPRRRDLLYKQRDALVEALKRHGYTFVTSRCACDLCRGVSSHGFDDPHDYVAGPTQRFPREAKPYYVYPENGALVILHKECEGCWRGGRYQHDHYRDFLQAMIPVIGRLDGCAKYDDSHPGWSPRLYIRLL